MQTIISLKANQDYSITLASRPAAGGGLLQFGWLYVIGESGSAKVQVIDNDNNYQPETEVPIPGIHASVIRESTPPTFSKITIKAGVEGFRGEVHFDLLKKI